MRQNPRPDFQWASTPGSHIYGQFSMHSNGFSILEFQRPVSTSVRSRHLHMLVLAHGMCGEVYTKLHVYKGDQVLIIRPRIVTFPGQVFQLESLKSKMSGDIFTCPYAHWPRLYCPWTISLMSAGLLMELGVIRCKMRLLESGPKLFSLLGWFS